MEPPHRASCRSTGLSAGVVSRAQQGIFPCRQLVNGWLASPPFAAHHIDANRASDLSAERTSVKSETASRSARPGRVWARPGQQWLQLPLPHERGEDSEMPLPRRFGHVCPQTGLLLASMAARCETCFFFRLHDAQSHPVAAVIVGYSAVLLAPWRTCGPVLLRV